MSDAVPPPDDDFDTKPLGAGLDLADPASPLAPLYLSLSQFLLLALLLAVFLAFNLVPLWHSDVWGHVGLGRWMIDHGEFPEHEPTSPFTDKTQRLNHSGWLSQVAYAGAFDGGSRLAGGDRHRQLAGGAAMLRFLHQLVVLGLLGSLALAYTRATGSARGGIVGLMLFLVFGYGLIAVQRPQAFGLMLFALLMAVLLAPISRRMAYLGIPLLMVLWANLHGSFAVGFGLLGITFVGRGIETGISQTRWNDVSMQRLFLAGVLSTLAVTALNPHGPWLFSIVAKFGGHPNIPTATEWQPIRFSLGPGGHWAYSILAALAVGTFVASPKKLTPTTWLWAVLFGLGPLVQQRLFIWWLLVLPAALLPHWAAIAERWRVAEWRSQRDLRKTILFGALLVPALMYSPPVRWLVQKGPPPAEKSLSGATPWRAALELADPALKALPKLRAFLDAHYPKGQLPGPILTTETTGDFFYESMPAANQPLAFSHIHLFEPAYWRRFLGVVNEARGWREFADEFKANLIVIEPGNHAALAAQLRAAADWAVVHDDASDPTRRDPRQQLLVAIRRKPVE